MHSIVRKSPTGTMAGHATGLYRAEGGVTFGALGSGSATVTDSDLNLQLSQFPVKTPKSKGKKDSAILAGVSDTNMGVLRSGKPYSPTRLPQTGRGRGIQRAGSTGPSTRHTPYDNEGCRRQRSSDGHQFLEPSPKQLRSNARQTSVQSSTQSPALNNQCPIVSPSTGVLIPEGTAAGLPATPLVVTPPNAATLVKVAQPFNMNDFMTKMETLVKDTVEAAVQRSMQVEVNKLKDENAKSLELLQKSIDSHGKSISAMESEIVAMKASHDQANKKIGDSALELQQNFDEQIRKVNDVVSGLTVRLDSADKKMEGLNTKLNSLRDGKPHGKQDSYPTAETLVMHRVAIQPGRDSIGMARLIIHDVLNIKDVAVVRAKIGRKYKNGKHTLKVQLDSVASARKVLRVKGKLGRAPGDDLKAIWIRQDKTDHQRVAEYNYNVLLDEFKLGDKYCPDFSGRLQPTKEQGDPPEGNLDLTEQTPASMSEGGQEPVPGQSSTANAPSRGRGRGRGQWRGRGYKRTVAAGGRADRVRGPPSPVHVDETILQAFRAPNPAPPTDGADSTHDVMETNDTGGDE